MQEMAKLGDVFVPDEKIHEGEDVCVSAGR